MTEVEDPICQCGDASSLHVDGCEQCFIPECGCQEFEEDCEPTHTAEKVCDICGERADIHPVNQVNG